MSDRLTLTRHLNQTAIELVALANAAAGSPEENLDVVINNFFHHQPLNFRIQEGFSSGMEYSADSSVRWKESLSDPRFAAILRQQVQTKLKTIGSPEKARALITALYSLGMPKDSLSQTQAHLIFRVKKDEPLRDSSAVFRATKAKSITVLVESSEEAKRVQPLLNKRYHQESQNVSISVVVQPAGLFDGRRLFIKQLASCLPPLVKTALMSDPTAVLFVSSDPLDVDASDVAENSPLRQLRLMVLTDLFDGVALSVSEHLLIQRLSSVLLSAVSA